MMERHPQPIVKNCPVSRRTFLKGVGTAVTAAFAPLVWSPQASAAAGVDASLAETPAILIDLTRCVGCNSCALACKQANNLPDTEVVPQGPGNEVYTYVQPVVIGSSGSDGEVRYVKRQCMHCLEPACVAACPAAAMYKSDLGPVVYRPNRCLGCRYCQVACPFGVPTFDWQNPITPRIGKCWFCYERQIQGEQPACAAACPTGALHYGKRDELLAQAHGRIASTPDRYVDHVFGEHEVGGTSMLYLSEVPFEDIGFPVGLPEEPASVATEKIMRSLPAVILGAGALAVGTAVYTHKFAPAHHGTGMDSTAVEASGIDDESNVHKQEE